MTKFVPRRSIPKRAYKTKWEKVWTKAGQLAKGGEALAVDPDYYKGSINALRCALRRQKRNGSLPPDILVSHVDGIAYLSR